MLKTLQSARPISHPLIRTTTQLRSFHPTAVKMVKAGDKIPNVDLDESSPGDKVNLSTALKGKGLIIGVPAAFSEYNALIIASPSVLMPRCISCHYQQ